jgi:hypothetical protein
MSDPGDICRARNMQFSQRLLRPFFGQTIFVHDRRDSISDLGIAEYLA